MNTNLYIKVFRPGHWIKNTFTLLGSFGAIFLYNVPFSFGLIYKILLGLLLSCFISSVNYVINEILDASYDAFHPEKKYRPIPSGQITLYKLIISAFTLLVLTFAISILCFNKTFNLSILALFIAGLIYNIRPIRAKDIPFLDVISESVNNPIRLFIGWYAVGNNFPHPPLAILLFFWLLGAFLMTAKRTAEFKMLGSNGSLYRPTYKYYSLPNLSVFLIFYAVMSSIFFIYIAVRYKNSLLISLPFYLITLIWYIKLTYQMKTLVVEPEHIYKYPLFALYILFCLFFSFITILML